MYLPALIAVVPSIHGIRVCGDFATAHISHIRALWKLFCGLKTVWIPLPLETWMGAIVEENKEIEEHKEVWQTDGDDKWWEESEIESCCSLHRTTLLCSDIRLWDMRFVRRRSSALVSLPRVRPGRSGMYVYIHVHPVKSRLYACALFSILCGKWIWLWCSCFLGITCMLE